MVLWSGGKAPLRYHQQHQQQRRHHEAQCRWNIRGSMLMTLTVAICICISLTSFWAFWVPTRSRNRNNHKDGLELDSPRKQPLKGTRDADVTAKIDDASCIPPKRSRGLEHIQVVKPSSDYSQKKMKILCFLMTDSTHHATKVKAVRETWGSKCDKLLIASNQTDPSIGAVRMKSDPSYSNLWGKLEETIRYIYDHYLMDEHEYGWFVKADDDSYILMENLRYFLSNITNDDDDDKLEKPLIYGRRYSYPPLVDLPNEPRFFPDLPENQAFRERFKQRVHDTLSGSKNLIYTQGGAAQVMNRKYLEELVHVLDSPDKVVGTPPEGMEANPLFCCYCCCCVLVLLLTI
jgi:hypothetical protein